MGTLTGCMKKAGAALNAEDREALIARSRELRAAGQSAIEAATGAIEERIATLSALVPPEAVAPPAGPDQQDLIAKARADAQAGEFTLTGSGRAADQNPDQGVMFDASENQDFQDTELLPLPEVSEGQASQQDVAAVARIQREFSKRVKDFASLNLTAMPRRPKPNATASALEQMRYAASDLVEKLFGKRVVFFSSNIQFANGMQADYLPGMVFVSESTTRPIMAVLGHELTHSLRGSHPELYDKLANRVSAMLEEPGRYHQQLNAKREKKGMPPLAFDKLREELIADIVGDNFTDPAFWRAMTTGQPSMFQRVLRVIRDFLDNLLTRLKNERPYGTEKYLDDVRGARDAVVDAMRAFAESPKTAAAAVVTAAETNLSEAFDEGKPPSDNGEDGVMFSLAPNILPPKEGLARAFQRKAQDQFNRFNTVRDWAKENGANMTPESNVWAYEERMHGRIATRIEDFREKRLKPAIQAIQKAGFSMEQVGEYLHAQHAEERNKQILSIDPKTTAGSGMTDADARAILAAADPKLAALANDLRKITDETKAILLKAGIISKDMTDAWEAAYQNYVPLKGGDDAPAGQTGTGKGLNVSGRQKRAMGHSTREENIVENILRDHERAITLAEKNFVGQSLLAFVADLGNEDIASIGKPEKRKVLKNTTDYEVRDDQGNRVGIFDSLAGANQFIKKHSQGLFVGTLTANQVKGDPQVAFMATPMLGENEVNVYVGGFALRVQMNDELLARAYRKSGAEGLNQLMAMNREINGFLSKAYTGYNPEFLFTNIIRDLTTGIINVTGQFGSTVSARALANYPKSFATLMRYAFTGKETPAITAYRAAGGSTGAAYLSDIERIGKDVQGAYDEYRGVIATLKGRGAVAAGRTAARKFVGHLLGWFENINQAGENAMRLSVFESVRTTAGYTVNDAASAAKNATVNFNRRGEWGQVLGAMYLFFNPAIQGTAAIFDTMVNGKNRYQAMALAGSMGVMAYLSAAVQFGGGDDDDDTWNAIPDYVKDKNLIIRTGEKAYATIPVPYGYGFLFSLGNAIYALQKGRDKDKVALNMASNLLEHFSPIGNPLGGDKLDTRGLAELVPGAIGGELMRNAIRVAVNRSSLGGDIVPDSPFDKGKPDNLKLFRSSKGTMYEKAAVGLNELTGGTKATAGAVDVSPETLKYWVRVVTGGSGAFVADSVGLGGLAVRYAATDDKAERDALKPTAREIPIVRRFLKEEGVQETRRLFWDAVNEVRDAKADLHRAQQFDDEAGAQRVDAQRGELVAMAKYTDRYVKSIKAARDEVDAVMADTTTTLAQKRAKARELEAEESRMYTAYVRQFTQARAEAKAERAKEAATR